MVQVAPLRIITFSVVTSFLTAVAMISFSVLHFSLMSSSTPQDHGGYARHRHAAGSEVLFPTQRDKTDDVMMSCGVRMTRWVGGGRKRGTVGSTRESPSRTRDGTPDEILVPHVSACRSCCACDWPQLQAVLAAVEADGPVLSSFPPHSIVGGEGTTTDPSSPPVAGETNPEATPTRVCSVGQRNARPWVPQSVSDAEQIDNVDDELPVCTVCRGCTHLMLPPPAFYVGFNHTFKALKQRRQGSEVS